MTERFIQLVNWRMQLKRRVVGWRDNECARIQGAVKYSPLTPLCPKNPEAEQHDSPRGLPSSGVFAERKEGVDFVAQST